MRTVVYRLNFSQWSWQWSTWNGFPLSSRQSREDLKRKNWCFKEYGSPSGYTRYKCLAVSELNNAVYRKRIHISILGNHYGHTKAPHTLWSLLPAVCGRIRRGHHASLSGAQGEGIHVPDTMAESEPSPAAAQVPCSDLNIGASRPRIVWSMCHTPIISSSVVATVA